MISEDELLRLKAIAFGSSQSNFDKAFWSDGGTTVQKLITEIEDLRAQLACKAARGKAMSPGESWWGSTSRPERIKLMREMGFGDVRVYSAYRWQDFAPHTRVEIDRIIEAKSSEGGS
jgi:hypothetical protein